MGCAFSFMRRFCWCDNDDAYAPPLTIESWREECEHYQRTNYANKLGVPHRYEAPEDTSGLYHIYLR